MWCLNFVILLVALTIVILDAFADLGVKVLYIVVFVVGLIGLWLFGELDLLHLDLRLLLTATTTIRRNFLLF